MLVAEHAPALDTETLARRALALRPRVATETPYLRVRCRVRASPPPVPAERDAREPARHLRGVLERVVDRSLDGARHVAVLTGGGLDSGALLALAHTRAAARGIRVFAVALDYDGPGSDRPYLDALEKQLRCEVIRVDPASAARRLILTRGVDAAPLVWPTSPMEIETMAVAREHGADLVLTGAGGDDAFDGDPRSLSDVVLAGRPLEAVRRARRMRAFATPRWPVYTWLVRPIVVRAVPRRIRAHRMRRHTAAPEWAGPVMHAALEREAAERASDALHSRRPLHPDEIVRDARYDAYVAALRHQHEVAAGIERRDPYVDPEVTEAVRWIRRDRLMSGDIRRGLFRDALRDVLPHALYEREDKAELEPALERFIEAAGGTLRLRELADAECLSELGIVERSRFRAAFAAFAAARSPERRWDMVWPAVCVEAFLRARNESAR